jgi:hypothetical protein
MSQGAARSTAAQRKKTATTWVTFEVEEEAAEEEAVEVGLKTNIRKLVVMGSR